jgi:hypothetical protein
VRGWYYRKEPLCRRPHAMSTAKYRGRRRSPSPRTPSNWAVGPGMPSACRRYRPGRRFSHSPWASRSARSTALSCRALNRRHAVGSACDFFSKNHLLICIFLTDFFVLL